MKILVVLVALIAMLFETPTVKTAKVVWYDSCYGFGVVEEINTGTKFRVDWDNLRIGEDMYMTLRAGNTVTFTVNNEDRIIKVLTID